MSAELQLTTSLVNAAPDRAVALQAPPPGGQGQRPADAGRGAPQGFAQILSGVEPGPATSDSLPAAIGAALASEKLNLNLHGPPDNNALARFADTALETEIAGQLLPPGGNSLPPVTTSVRLPIAPAPASDTGETAPPSAAPMRSDALAALTLPVHTPNAPVANANSTADGVTAVTTLDSEPVPRPAPPATTAQSAANVDARQADIQADADLELDVVRPPATPLQRQAGAEAMPAGRAGDENVLQRMESALTSQFARDDGGASRHLRHASGHEFNAAIAAVNGADSADEFGLQLSNLKFQSAARPLATPVGSEQWARGLGDRLLLMTDNGVQTARISLVPEHLGPLDVKITVEDDVARVWFGAQHATTRDALESAMPRLREMLAGQGLELAEADVSDRRSMDRDATPEQRTSFDAPAGTTMDLPMAGQPPPGALSNRLIDTWA